MAEAIAIVSIGVQGAEVVAKIVRFAIETKHFKKTCEKLKNDAVLILNMIARAGDAKVNAQDAGRIENSLRTCLAFVTLCCQDWGVLRSSFEVAFRRKHEIVEKELRWCTELLIADTATKLLANQGEKHQELVEKFGRVDARLDSELRSLRKEVSKSREITALEDPQLSTLVTIYKKDDPRLHLQTMNTGASSFQGQLNGLGEVECLRLVDKHSTAGIQLPRLINIYGKISHRTAARRLFGVLKTEQGDFAVMESLAGAKSLESSLAKDEFLAFPLAKRLRFLYEICQAVEYFHSIGVLLKSLSSSPVFYKESSAGTGHLRPIIAGLENGRLMTESSVELEYDVRFEAPDFIVQGQRMHTPYTDVWSLAVLVRYCITGGLPLSSPFVTSPEAKMELRKQLKNPDFLCESPHLKDLPDVRKTLNWCFLAKGSLRPTVPEIGRVIMDAFVDQTHGSHNVAGGISLAYSENLPEAKAGAMTKIHRVRSNQKEKIGKDNRLSKADWLKFLHASDLEVDAVAEYIVGASAWLDLVEAADCEEQFDATDNGQSSF
ncbi:hypothetical protein NW759_014964 [Fusarium solani]|nr:hypothetical protein NW759_014964 [Fusarium solani]